MLLVKIVLIGDGGVGKTALRERFLGKGFSASYLMTIGADFAIRTAVLSNGIEMRFQIWDLAGQPRFEAVREHFYRSATGAIVAFDVTRRKSFENQERWLNELWKNNGEGPIPCLILGNKIDLRPKNGAPHFITTQEGTEWAQRVSSRCRKYGFSVPYIETSAKTGENVSNAFEILGVSIANFLFSKEKGLEEKQAMDQYLEKIKKVPSLPTTRAYEKPAPVSILSVSAPIKLEEETYEESEPETDLSALASDLGISFKEIESSPASKMEQITPRKELANLYSEYQTQTGSPILDVKPLDPLEEKIHPEISVLLGSETEPTEVMEPEIGLVDSLEPEILEESLAITPETPIVEPERKDLVPTRISLSTAERGISDEITTEYMETEDYAYWMGVADCIEMLDSFAKWREDHPHAKSEEEMLEIVNTKAIEKLGPSILPSAMRLGIPFDTLSFEQKLTPSETTDIATARRTRSVGDKDEQLSLSLYAALKKLRDDKSR